MTEPRAIVFDLDDTLYPLRGFVRSGFQVIARRIEQERGFSGWRTLRALCRASQVAPGRELQHLCEHAGLPAAEVARFVGLIRCHTPRLRLPAETVRVLAALRSGWRIGVLTNGQPAIQRRKVAALGLAAYVDAVVFARECGQGTGKPDPVAFETVLDRLGAKPARSVFVGDDLEADVIGAWRAGMHAIYLAGHHSSVVRPTRDQNRRPRPVLGVRVEHIGDVPAIAWALVEGGACVRAA